MQLVSSQVGMWVKVPSADVFFLSGRPTEVIGFQLFLTPNDKSLCFGSFASWQRQWYDEGWDPQPQVDGHQWEGTKMVGGASKGSPGMMYVFSDPKWGAVQNPKNPQNHRVFAERSSRLSRHDIIMKFIGVVVETQVTVVYWSSLFCEHKVPVLTFEEDPRAFILCTQQKLDVERHLKGSLPVGNAGLARDTLPKMQ